MLQQIVQSLVHSGWSLRMRLIAAIIGVCAVGLGTIQTFFGLDLLAYRNLICFDVCGSWQSGTDRFWMWIGVAVLALGTTSILWAIYSRQPAS